MKGYSKVIRKGHLVRREGQAYSIEKKEDLLKIFTVGDLFTSSQLLGELVQTSSENMIKIFRSTRKEFILKTTAI